MDISIIPYSVDMVLHKVCDSTFIRLRWLDTGWPIDHSNGLEVHPVWIPSLNLVNSLIVQEEDAELISIQLTLVATLPTNYKLDC